MKEIRVDRVELENFCKEIFFFYKLKEEDAISSAKVLVAADARGISSHGVSRLKRYVNGLKDGSMDTNAKVYIINESPMSIVINANGAMGAPISVSTMNKVIEKAKNVGAAFGTVRDSNHFGIAGYYASMALDHDMLGIAMTNTAALGVPTFGTKVMFGTNPIAFAAPANKEGSFILDMSTTVITRGKVEVYKRLDKELPEGWAIDKDGNHASDSTKLLDDMFNRLGGGILPLGGAGEKFGGHKGYGLAVMVDILCSLLSGAPSGPDVADTSISSGRVSHFFGAIKIENFRDPKDFRNDMDKFLIKLRECPPKNGQQRVYYAGLKEHEREVEANTKGIILLENIYNELVVIGSECKIKPPTLIDF